MRVPPDACLVSPAAERNRQPILELLQRVLPPQGRVLEIASGTGQHVVHFARALPGVSWQPSDPDGASRVSIDAWRAHTGSRNVLPALMLDVTAPQWPAGPFEALLCINLLHISPWPATAALFTGATRVLTTEGLVVLYGPYRIDGGHTAPSNAEFDASLRARNAQWGVRDLDEVADAAAGSGFVLAAQHAMPANNLSLVFRRRGPSGR